MPREKRPRFQKWVIAQRTFDISWHLDRFFGISTRKVLVEETPEYLRQPPLSTPWGVVTPLLPGSGPGNTYLLQRAAQDGSLRRYFKNLIAGMTGLARARLNLSRLYVEDLCALASDGRLGFSEWALSVLQRSKGKLVF